MQLDQILASVPAVRNVKTEQHSGEMSGKQSRSWARRFAIGAAAVGLGMYLRQRRSKGDRKQSTPTQIDITDVAESETDVSSRGGGMGRRLKMMVISTVVFALARWIVRRMRSGR